jgi:hypothetical protein
MPSSVSRSVNKPHSIKPVLLPPVESGLRPGVAMPDQLAGRGSAGAVLVCLNAGGLLRPGRYGKVPIVRDLARANSLLYRQSTSLRTRAMLQSFNEAVPRCLKFHCQTTPDEGC